jgi:DNA-binding transcriptional MerR regulator
MDDEWMALLKEAKSLGLTVDDIREWLKRNSEEKQESKEVTR